MVVRQPGERSLVTRTFLIIEAFTQGDRSLPLAELTRRTGLPKSTVHRIATELVDMGMLERDGSALRLGRQLFEIGLLVPDLRELREIGLPYLEDLHAHSGEVVHLGVPAGADVLYVVKLAGHGQVPLPTRDGGRMPIHATGLGKAILAHSPRAVVRAVLGGDLRPLTPYTIVSPAVLADQLAEIARRGVAYDREEAVLGTLCVGAPILDRAHRARAAVSITGPASRFDPPRFAGAVKAAASGIARDLMARDRERDTTAPLPAPGAANGRSYP